MLRSAPAQLRTALIVTRREVRDQFRDWRIIFPIILLTLFFPIMMNFTARQVVGFVGRYGAPIVGERMIPFLLLVVGFFPISISLVIALESFVGEKERRSIEPLLISPLSDWQLYIGKLLAAIVPPLLASYLGITVYLLSIYFQIGWQPEPDLLIQIVILTTVQALVMVSGAVVISSQTTSIRAANLLASFIILPIALLIQVEAILMFWGRNSALWWVIFGLVVVAVLLVRTGISHFNREELLGKEFDSINLSWGWFYFRTAFVGKARSLGQWYRQEIRSAVGKITLPVLLMAIALLTGAGLGASQASVFVLPPDLINLQGLDGGFLEGLEVVQFFSVSGVLTVWMHNIRAILIASILGAFTFGVLGVIVLMLPLFLIGYFMASMATVGLSPLTFLTALVLPHGVLEIPAIIIAGAAILRLGATLAAPANGNTVGEAWLQSFADWAKVMIGLVIPLLLGAAALEVIITPRIAVWILGS